MRLLIVLALLAGCGPGQFYSPERIAERAEANRLARERSAAQELAYQSSPEGQADMACRTKVQFAMAGHVQRSFLDLEGTAKANQLHASCMDYWRRTGQMP